MWFMPRMQLCDRSIEVYVTKRELERYQVAAGTTDEAEASEWARTVLNKAVADRFGRPPPRPTKRRSSRGGTDALPERTVDQASDDQDVSPDDEKSAPNSGVRAPRTARDLKDCCASSVRRWPHRNDCLLCGTRIDR